ncbi:MAG: GLUG motif-containing protein, partial [Planctomycetota bacterium]
MKKLIFILLCCSAASGTILINSFNSGQLSKDLKYRADLEQHGMASETMTNVLVRPQGMGYRRPGTEYIDTKRTAIVTPAVGAYPTLRATTDQADPGLTQGTAISNITELQAMENDLTDNYYLTGDIDASATSSWNGGAGFDPIGTVASRFTGTFDGNGYTISDLTINRPTEQYVGLFGWVRTTAKIANVTLSNCTIAGDDYVAALIAYVDTNTTDEPLIQNCHVSGTITSRPGAVTSQVFGGLIGWAQGRKATSDNVYIYDSSSSCSIDASGTTGTTSYHGGFVGWTEQVVIQNCFATGNVDAGTDAQSSRTGGFIGHLDELTRISYSYATGNVSGYNRVGGFVGNMPGAADDDGYSYIQKCYATGNVTCETGNAGAFAGINAVDITDCYAWGNVTITGATGNVGGFTGIDFNPSSPDYRNAYSIGTTTGGNNEGGFIATSQAGTFTNVYWDTEASGDAT